MQFVSLQAVSAVGCCLRLSTAWEFSKTLPNANRDHPNARGGIEFEHRNARDRWIRWAAHLRRWQRGSESIQWSAGACWTAHENSIIGDWRRTALPLALLFFNRLIIVWFSRCCCWISRLTVEVWFGAIIAAFDDYFSTRTSLPPLATLGLVGNPVITVWSRSNYPLILHQHDGESRRSQPAAIQQFLAPSRFWTEAPITRNVGAFDGHNLMIGMRVQSSSYFYGWL